MHRLREMQSTPEWSDWNWQLRHSVGTPEDMAELVGRERGVWTARQPVAARYPVRVTPYYLSLIRAPVPTDPILRQVLPDQRELVSSDLVSPDPLGEADDSPMPGLVHRYPDRALLLLTCACAVHCRHCMRKRGWDRESGEDISCHAMDQALDYIADHGEIREVLLSGGDPLLLPNDVLEAVLARLRRIGHLEVVRIGSRLPVVLPQRFTAAFCDLLGRHGTVWLATHFNHPNELTPQSAVAIRNLLRAGVPTVNQTVLLKGVNDSADTLRDLCRQLLVQRIKPYYLFHGDPVAGTLHFRTGLESARRIVEELRRSMSGLAQPTFAFDLPQGGGKVRVEPESERGYLADGTVAYRGRRGEMIAYP